MAAAAGRVGLERETSVRKSRPPRHDPHFQHPPTRRTDARVAPPYHLIVFPDAATRRAQRRGLYSVHRSRASCSPTSYLRFKSSNSCKMTNVLRGPNETETDARVRCHSRATHRRKLDSLDYLQVERSTEGNGEQASNSFVA